MNFNLNFEFEFEPVRKAAHHKKKLFSFQSELNNIMQTFYHLETAKNKHVTQKTYRKVGYIAAYNQSG